MAKHKWAVPKCFIHFKLYFKHIEHKTTTQSDHDYNTRKLLRPVSNPSHGPSLGRMTIPIVCIKEAERGTFSPPTLSALAHCSKKEPAPLSPWGLYCWPLLSLQACLAFWLPVLLLFLSLFPTTPSAEPCGELLTQFNIGMSVHDC